MKYRLHFLWPNETSDSIIIDCENKEEANEKAEYEIRDREAAFVKLEPILELISEEEGQRHVNLFNPPK